MKSPEFFPIEDAHAKFKALLDSIDDPSVEEVLRQEDEADARTVVPGNRKKKKAPVIKPPKFTGPNTGAGAMDDWQRRKEEREDSVSALN